MNILSIETSAPQGSVALQTGDQISIARLGQRQHTEQIIEQIDAALAQADLRLSELDAIAFGRGPGSFIGVRLAGAVAQGLAMAAGVGIVPISSLAAMALQAARVAPVEPDEVLRAVVCLDARMNEVYLAEFLWSAGKLEASGPERLALPEEISPPDEGAFVALGNGFSAYPELAGRMQACGGQLIAELVPRAEDLLTFAAAAVAADQLIAPDQWRADYLRDESAWRRLE